MIWGLILSCFFCNRVNNDGWTAIYFAAMNGWLTIVEFLVQEQSANMDHMDRWGRTPLHWVARFNNELMFKCLLNLGYDYKKRDIEGMTCYKLADAYHAVEVKDVFDSYINDLKAKAYLNR